MCFEIYRSFKAPWSFKFFNKVDMFLKLCQYVKDLLNIELVPDQFVTKKMCEDNPWMLEQVLDQFVTQEM